MRRLDERMPPHWHPIRKARRQLSRHAPTRHDRPIPQNPVFRQGLIRSATVTITIPNDQQAPFHFDRARRELEMSAYHRRVQQRMGELIPSSAIVLESSGIGWGTFLSIAL